MNLFIQQIELPRMTLAYTISSNYKDAYDRIENYLKLGNVNIIDVKLYHAEIRTMNSRVVFLYTEALEAVSKYDKTEIQILSVEAGFYLTTKIDKKLYKDILFKDQVLQNRFNKEIDDYCKLHNVKLNMSAFPYLSISVDSKEQLLFPIKKNKAD
ncbi:MAG: hypothetical protein PHF05_09725 [Candidatus Izemoplasmatales bacterium]|nr:hypothetical protein [Candidatus Izemoplasmatales bacterium]MDY0138874.1 hypothetical protein [Candidatus Izemoplasmatales bacterium]